MKSAGMKDGKAKVYEGKGKEGKKAFGAHL